MLLQSFLLLANLGLEATHRAKKISTWNQVKTNDVLLVAAKCADPGALSNGFRRGGDFRHGKKVAFGCRRGFRLKGVNIITCNNGNWSNPLPVCAGR